MADITKELAIPAGVSNLPVLTQDLNGLLEVLEENMGAAQISVSTLDKIKLPSAGTDFFQVQTIDGPVPMKELVGVVVGVDSGRAFWRTDDSAGTPPDCSSGDLFHGYGNRGNDANDGPHDCVTCPLNQFGSAMKDGKAQAGKACGERKLLLFLLDDGILPQVVQVPGTSIKNWDTYLTRLSNYKTAFTGVATKISMVDAQSRGGQKYKKMDFASGGSLPQDARLKVKAYANMLKDKMAKASPALGASEDAPPPYADAEAPTFEHEEGANG